MLLDARDIGENARLDAGICIVGAGPAGITLARELAGHTSSVLLLESGGLESEASAQSLNDGSVVGDAYAGLRSTRHRAVGGSVRIWNTPVRREPGAKYAPLDETDFMARPDAPLSGWPFERTGLLSFYERAQRLCGLGPFQYEATGGHDTKRGPEISGENLIPRVYQFGQSHAFTGPNLGILRSADNVRLCHHATVIALRTNGGRRVTRLHVVDPSGRPFSVEARCVVLAAGAIENARLLLASPDASWIGNDRMGCCFMEHPRDYSLTLVPRNRNIADDFGFFDTHVRADGAMVAGRIALTSAAIRERILPNASVTLLPRLQARPARDAMMRVLDALRIRGRSCSTEGYGWSDTPDAGSRYDAFRLILNVEQWPHPENRIVLGTDRDRFGVPRVVLHWRWRNSDEAALERVRSLLVHEIENAGLGTIRRTLDTRVDPDAHHHAGTTRMHMDPRRGVVDEDCRVHGVDNLFIAGASVFPTAGFANPTLTIVALALRLAGLLATVV
jgi:choline dehydrogenase-like flavoprotein